MAEKHSTLTQNRLKELLHYDPLTGIFTWLVARGNDKTGFGKVAGWTNKDTGYMHVIAERKPYSQHRLAWFYVNGSWPVGDVDHINGAKTDNRIANLRDVTTQGNCRNQRAARSNSTSGLIGAKKAKNKWQSSIKGDGGYIHLGTFPTPEEAHAAYLEAKRRLHSTCTI